MLNLETREDLGDNQGSENPGGNENPGGDDSDDPGEGGLDRNNLEDGIYAVTGSMVKIDKTTASMSNEAINHTIKLTVKDGKYYLTMDFQGLKINSQFGYLGTLKYFLSGYTLDQYGSPQGVLKEVTIDAYQADENGNRVKDNGDPASLLKAGLEHLKEDQCRRPGLPGGPRQQSQQRQ